MPLAYRARCIHSSVAVVLGLLLALRAPSPALRPTMPVPAAAAAGFEELAGQIGRAEAWFAMAGEADAPDITYPAPGTLVSAPSSLQSTPSLTPTAYFPLVSRSEPPAMIERRAIWVTRYDWTTSGVAPTPGDIDAMVSKVSDAGFNTILFQVRAAGDAYYTPGLEPWASRLSAGTVTDTLGLNPGWDPLARMLEAGHAAGIEVHAYVNVYTAWLSPPNASYGALAPPATIPPQMFDRFTYTSTHPDHPGEYGLGWAWRHHDSDQTAMLLDWGSYLWASPGVDQVNDYVVDVVEDIVRRYAVDGVHLDLVRYAGLAYSYDPYSNAAAGSEPSSTRAQWQRDRITALVTRVRDVTRAWRPGAQVSAAVWPYYVDKWDWGLSEGYSDYYQDSRGWLASGAVDAIAPMLYGGESDSALKWFVLMADFLDASGGRPVYPGIGGSYATFEDIAWRIEIAREQGAQGHAIFSYSGLDSRGYWDDLAFGPYSVPASLP